MTMQYVKAVAVAALAVFATGVATAEPAAGDDLPLAFPKAALEGDDLVAIDDVVALAQLVAEDRWGDVRAGEPIPCTDIDGVVNCYMVPFRRGGDEMSGPDKIFEELQRNARIATRLAEEFAPPYATDDESPPELVQESVADGATLPMPPRVRPDGEVSHRAQYHAARLEHDRLVRDATGADRYGTVIVAARRSMYPLLAVYYYLPPFYLTGPEAAKRAASALGTRQVALENLVLLTPGEIYFRFDRDGRRVLVNAKTLTVIDDEPGFVERTRQQQVAAARSPKQAVAADELVDTAQAWDEFLARTR